jgi:DNA replication protein DnaC
VRPRGVRRGGPVGGRSAECGRGASTETVEQLVALERRAREATNLARRTRTAGLGKFKPLDRFDWSHPRKIDRPLVEQLVGLNFAARGENVLLRGQSGVGKTMLAKNLGHAALASGYSVRFVSRRHEQRSTIISTNLALKQWGTVFPGAACVGALVDRFAQHYHRVEIDADSWRDRHGFERDDPTPPAGPAAAPSAAISRRRHAPVDCHFSSETIRRLQ